MRARLAAVMHVDHVLTNISLPVDVGAGIKLIYMRSSHGGNLTLAGETVYDL